jgi:hypothetical protein
MAAPPESSGVLLVRVWVDGEEVRARVIHQPEAAGGGTGQAVSGVEDIVAVVRAWLEELVRAAGQP